MTTVVRCTICLLTLAALAFELCGQAPGVPIYQENRETRDFADLTNAVALLRESGGTVSLGEVRTQLRRSSCRLDLPAPNGKKLTARELWQRARISHVRIGWFYTCNKCDARHLKLSGGYFLTADGAAGTSYHGIEPERDMLDGILVAADDTGRVFAVTEVLAADRYRDTCIVRIKGDGFRPLPLNTKVHPGDTVFCLSDPLGRRGFFSQGIVNRFFQLPERRRADVPGAPGVTPTRINVSTDWAPGSSGAAVLDEYGNVIGQVSTVSAPGDATAESGSVRDATPGMIVFREAASACDVLALVQRTNSE